MSATSNGTSINAPDQGVQRRIRLPKTFHTWLRRGEKDSGGRYLTAGAPIRGQTAPGYNASHGVLKCEAAGEVRPRRTLARPGLASSGAHNPASVERSKIPRTLKSPEPAGVARQRAIKLSLPCASRQSMIPVSCCKRAISRSPCGVQGTYSADMRVYSNQYERPNAHKHIVDTDTVGRVQAY